MRAIGRNTYRWIGNAQIRLRTICRILSTFNVGPNDCQHSWFFLNGGCRFVYLKIVPTMENARQWIWLTPCVFLIGCGKPWCIGLVRGKKLMLWKLEMLLQSETKWVRTTQSIQMNATKSKLDCCAITVIRTRKMMHEKPETKMENTNAESDKQFSCANQRPTTSISKFIQQSFNTTPFISHIICNAVWVTLTLRVPYTL